MTRRLVVSLLAALALAAIAVLTDAGVQAQGFSFAVADHAECSHLMMLRLPDIKLSEAVSVAAPTTGAVRVAHCKVSGVIGTEIRFTLLLPDQWNKKLFMGGGGGFVGTIQNSALPTVNLGYATVGTDTGHQGGTTDARWALNNLERQVNFGYLAVHRTAEAAKAIIASYYTSPSTKNYFMGCSRGGGQALMEAQRFPEDFDGIVAGAPAYDWTGIGAQFVRSAQVSYPDPRNVREPLFTAETLKAVEQQILDRCDALDGVKDGVMEDPRRCTFDVNTLIELTPAQRDGLRALYAPVTNKDGEIYPGRPFGGEGQPFGWPTWIVGTPGAASLDLAFSINLFKYIVFGDPEWDFATYQFDNWKKDVARTATFLNATDANLDAFKARGGKLILWHGWADPALTPLASIRYHEQVSARDPAARDYFRMFMLPGVLHCMGGAGPDNVEWAATIADWVEKGQAPERVVARKMANGAVVRSRPLCAYPQKAEYKGSGSTDDEASFVCR